MFMYHLCSLVALLVACSDKSSNVTNRHRSWAGCNTLQPSLTVDRLSLAHGSARKQRKHTSLSLYPLKGHIHDYKEIAKKIWTEVTFLEIVAYSSDEVLTCERLQNLVSKYIKTDN